MKKELNLRTRFKELIYKLLARKMFFAVLCEIEKIVMLFVIVKFNYKVTWEFFAIIFGKDIVILTLLGLIGWEKISLKYEKT